MTLTIFTKNGKLTATVRTALIVLAKCGEIRPTHVIGRGRYIQNSTSTYGALAPEICAYFGIPTVTGNDAPRGGKTGDFVRLARKQDAAKISKILDAYAN
ncbi:hypothetical protein IAI58_19170 (plasmid) [Roseomonas marmotae]|uniref:hypothetical protein n=1 Tax=Roseomonas marmotae TaxID=2768161 RepID=UPI001AD79881|nr:hypothetical protein [Roseomonas marmotae]QTI81465.1 hypothetical protein IAI58_19170 [Roseomonas marmotae]